MGETLSPRILPTMNTYQIAFASLAVVAAPVWAQTPAASVTDGLRFRTIGPAAMSGRFVDLAVYESQPHVFYAASATGGLAPPEAHPVSRAHKGLAVAPAASTARRAARRLSWLALRPSGKPDCCGVATVGFEDFAVTTCLLPTDSWRAAPEATIVRQVAFDCKAIRGPVGLPNL